MKFLSLILLLITLSSQVVLAKKNPKIKFKQIEIVTDFRITHPLQTANLLGLNSEQLVVIGENKDKQRILVVFELLVDEKQYIEFSRIVIPDNYLSYDLLKTKQQDKLIFQSNKEVIEYVAKNKAYQVISKIKSIYLQDKAAYLVARDFIRDINGDKLEDILISDFSHLHLLLQNTDGSFFKQSLPIKPKMQSDLDSSSFTKTPVYFADMNQDSRADIIEVKNGSLDIYYQNEVMHFNETAFQLNVAIDFKALQWWEMKESDGRFVDQSKVSHRSVHEIKDINNDKISDLVIRFSKNEGVLDQNNNYEIYLGQYKDGLLSYSSKADSVISADGTISKFRIIDLNGDNKSEVVVDSLDIGVSQIIGALLSGSIDQDLYIFKMDENDNFQKEPLIEKEVELNFSISSGTSGAPVIRLADFNGDGIKDLMFSDGKKTLRINTGTSNQKLLTRRSNKHKVLLPQNGNHLKIADLDHDGKDDVVMRYGRQDDEELSHKLVFLFAK
jgi:hypothetical protein